MVTIEEFKNNITKKSRLLGLDLGSKRIGIAICDDNLSIATPFKTINNESLNKFIDELKLIVKENNIQGIIVGNPINMDGSMGKSSQSAKDFSANISKNITIPITMWDERFSSSAAFKITNKLDTNTTNKVKNLDKNAAAFILQGAIDFLTN